MILKKLQNILYHLQDINMEKIKRNYKKKINHHCLQDMPFYVLGWLWWHFLNLSSEEILNNMLFLDLYPWSELACLWVHTHTNTHTRTLTPSLYLCVCLYRCVCQCNGEWSVCVKGWSQWERHWKYKLKKSRLSQSYFLPP